MNNVFGYIIRDSSGRVFGNTSRQLSLRRQLQLCKGEALNLNIILVASGNFTEDNLIETQNAIQFMRDIYDDVAVGVRRIGWYQIPNTDAGGYATIGSGDEAHNLTDDWNGPSGALDVFVVRSMNGAAGWSAVDGPCSKDDKDEMTGSVVSLNGSYSYSGNTFAHEVGHYLGLSHVSSPTNFIGGNNGASNSNTAITTGQGNTMKKHCYVKNIC
jgi:hypothetical protein